MATPEQEKDARTKLDAALAELAQMTPDNLVRPELGVELNFEKGRPFLARTLRLFADLKEAALDNAPFTVLNQLQTAATEALNQLKSIQAFSVSQQNPVQARDALIDQVRDTYDNFYLRLTPHIAYSIRKGTDFAGLEREARRAVDEIRAAQAEQLQAQKAFSDEASRIVESMRRAAAEVGVAQHAIYFKTQADEHATESKRWLVATAVIGVLTFGVVAGLVSAYFLAPGTITGLTAGQAVQLGIAKIALLSVMYFALLFASRNYRAHRHNLTINKHRQNALSTFETFVKAASDQQTKDAVLLHAAQAIFAPQATGFSDRDTETHSSPQILEVFRASRDGAS